MRTRRPTGPTRATRTRSARPPSAAWLQSLFTTDPKPVTDQGRVRLSAIAARRPDLSELTDAALLIYCRSLSAEGRHQSKRHVLKRYGANVPASIIAQISQAADATRRIKHGATVTVDGNTGVVIVH